MFTPPAATLLATIKSGSPSPLRSLEAKAEGEDPAWLSVRARFSGLYGPVTSKLTAFEVPPPGPMFVTVIAAVPAFATSEAVTLAVTCEALTNVVGRGLWFQFTVDPATNPAPFTVIAMGPLPGDVASGTDRTLTQG